jgi:hypothetical protein
MRALSVVGRKPVLENGTVRATAPRIAARRPSVRDGIADVQAGQSPTCPIPIGRTTNTSISTSSNTMRSFISLRLSGCGTMRIWLAHI